MTKTLKCVLNTECCSKLLLLFRACLAGDPRCDDISDFAPPLPDPVIVKLVLHLAAVVDLNCRIFFVAELLRCTDPPRDEVKLGTF